MQNTIVYLIGYAGTGKYTIAKELARLTGAVIVDNQLINSPVFSGVGTFQLRMSIEDSLDEHKQDTKK